MLKPTTQYLFEGAVKLGYETKILSLETNLFVFNKEGRDIYCRGFGIGVNPAVLVKLASYKAQLNRYFFEQGIVMPVEAVIRPGDNDAGSGFISQSSMFYIKPVRGSLGNQVEQVQGREAAFTQAKYLANRYKKIFVLQEKAFGEEYRITIVKGDVFAVANRGCLNLVGDGVSTIKDLYNNVFASKDKATFMYKPLDCYEEIELFLQKKSLSLSSVLPSGNSLLLADAPNLYQGGYLKHVDILTMVHPSIHELARKIYKHLPLEYMGIDIIFEKSISVDLQKQNYWLIEVNPAANVLVHRFFEEDYNVRLLAVI